MKEIRIEFTPTVDDYGRAAHTVATRNTILWVITGWFGLPMLIVLLVTFFRGQINIGNINGWVFGLAISFVALMYPFSFSAGAKRQFIKSKPNIGVQIYHFDSTGIAMKYGTYEVKHDWTVLKNVFESNHFYFLTYAENPSASLFIPKRAFQSKEQENDFRDLVIHHVSNIQKIGGGLTGWKLSALVGILALIVNYYILSPFK